MLGLSTATQLSKIKNERTIFGCLEKKLHWGGKMEVEIFERKENVVKLGCYTMKKFFTEREIYF